MQDERLEGKPKTNDGSLPIMVYDYRDLPETSENIWHAQKAGWPSILTYDARKHLEEFGRPETSKERKKRMGKKRYENLEYVDAGSMGASSIPTSQAVWRDEYPFASTVENAGSTWVGNVDAEEQRQQARLIRDFYRKYDALGYAAKNGKPFWFEVKVIHMPQESESGS